MSFNIRRVVTLDRRDINLLCSRTEIGIVRISCPISDLYILSNHVSLMLDVRIYLFSFINYLICRLKFVILQL